VNSADSARCGSELTGTRSVKLTMNEDGLVSSWWTRQDTEGAACGTRDRVTHTHTHTYIPALSGASMLDIFSTTTEKETTVRFMF